MRAIYSDQYKTACIVAEDGDDANSLIEECWLAGATFDEADETLMVIQLRAHIGPELWTEKAVRRSVREQDHE